MLDPMTLQFVKERLKDQLEEAKKKQMLRAAKAAPHPLGERLLLRTGDLLISAGRLLHKRYKPAMQKSAG